MNLFSETYDFLQFKDLFSRTHDFMKTKKHKFVNKKGKCRISEKTKVKACCADKDLSSWTGLAGPDIIYPNHDFS